jgi:hypothetical protein
MVNAGRNLFDPNERDRIVADLIEDRVEDEWDTIENLISEYFDDTAKMIIEMFYEPFSITADDLPNILDRIISEGFQINTSRSLTLAAVYPYAQFAGANEVSVTQFTINDFCDNAVRAVDDPRPLINFNAHNLLDETVDIHLKPKITEVLGMSSDTLNGFCKKAIFQLYSCARVREDTEGWCEYIGNAVNDLTEDLVPILQERDVFIVNCE